MQKWLFDISERIEALQSVLDEAEDKSIEPDIKNALTGIYESDVPAAVADGIEYIKKKKKLIAGVDERIKEMTEYKKTLENRMKRRCFPLCRSWSQVGGIPLRGGCEGSPCRWTRPASR